MPFYGFLPISAPAIFYRTRGATRLQARFIPTHYVHFDAHVDAVAHLNDTECGLEKLNQYYLVNFSRKINNTRKGSFRGLIVLNGFSFL